jgi:hypothetical protein
LPRRQVEWVTALGACARDGHFLRREFIIHYFSSTARAAADARAS